MLETATKVKILIQVGFDNDNTMIFEDENEIEHKLTADEYLQDKIIENAGNKMKCIIQNREITSIEILKDESDDDNQEASIDKSKDDMKDESDDENQKASIDKSKDESDNSDDDNQ